MTQSITKNGIGTGATQPPRPDDFGITTEKLRRVETVLRWGRGSFGYVYFALCVSIASVWTVVVRTDLRGWETVLNTVGLSVAGVFLLFIPVGVPLLGLGEVVLEIARALIPDVRRTFEFQAATAEYEKARQNAREQLSIEAKRFEQQERDRLRRERMQQVNGLLQLAPRQFEHAVAQLYETMGYVVEVTPAVNDEGRDVIATRGRERLYIECKRYALRRTVGRPELQKLVGALPNSSARGVFVTTSSFSGPAREYAKARGVELVDGKALAGLLRKTYGESAGVTKVRVMCHYCGEMVAFPFGSGVQASQCANNHTVQFDPSTYTH